MANDRQKWFKFYGGDYLTDGKISSLSPAEKCVWVTILCLASINDPRGVIQYYDEDKIMATAGLSPLHDEWTETKGILRKLKKLKMISIKKEVIHITNFQKRQEQVSSSYDRVKRFREKSAEIANKMSIK